MNQHDLLPAIKRVTVADLEPIALGATFLGTGGGGDPYVGSLVAQVAMERQTGRQHVDVIAPEELADDDFSMLVAGMGAPSVMLEKLVNLAPLEEAVAMVEQRAGRKVTAILTAEMGGGNSMIPIAFAAQRGVPVIDGDGMGRAFPELQMLMPHIEGNPICPMAVVGDAGERVLIEAVPTVKHAEILGRPLSVAMGVKNTIACFPMDGEATRRSLVPGTLSLAHAIGNAILRGRREGDPFGALFACLSRSPHYRHHARLGEGRIIDVSRRIERGWTLGVCRVKTWEGDEMELLFRNEYLVAKRDGKTLATVPDLIMVLDAETAVPMTTDDIKYGQRVVVITTSAADCMRTPKALEIVGPDKFGLDEPFIPIEQRLSAQAHSL